MICKPLKLAIQFSLAGCLLLGGAGYAAEGQSSNTLDVKTAMQLTLEHSPSLAQAGYGLEMSRSTLMIERGLFNPNLNLSIGTSHDRNKTGDLDSLTPSDRALADAMGMIEMKTKADSANFSANLSKSFRTGISTNLSAMTMQNDPAYHPMGLGIRPNSTTVSFTLTVPFLKGAGRVSAGAGEKAAKLSYEADLADHHHTVSDTILRTITAFWQYAGNTEYLKQVLNSEKRVAEWIDRAGNNKLQGYLDDKKGRKIDAAQAMESAKIELAKAMGISAEALNGFAVPTDSFPSDWSASVNRFDQDALAKAWRKEAMENRMDVKAVKLREESAKVQLDKARKDVLPQLDLQLGTGYKGFSQYNDLNDVAKSYYDNVNGMDYSVSLSLNYSFGNDIAKGTRDLQQSMYRQSVVSKNDKLRTVELEVQNELSSVLGRMKKYVQIDQTVQSYADALVNLMRSGNASSNMATLISIMELEDKYLDAQKEKTSAKGDLATAVAKARFTTGTLTKVDNESGEIRLSNLETLPGW